MLLYIILSYLIMLGIIIGNYKNKEKVDWYPLIFAPILIPIFLGIWWTENK